MSPITLLSLISLTDAQLNKIKNVSDELDIHVIEASSASDLPDDVMAQAEIVLGHRVVGDVEHFPKLKWVQAPSAGINYFHARPIWNSDVMITTASGIHATPIAERALAMMLAFRANLLAAWNDKAATNWPEDRAKQYATIELRGSTLGIVGYGAIGAELGRLADALGMRVLALNRSGERKPIQAYREPGCGDPEMRIPETMFSSDQLPDMLAECDHVVMLAPLTEATRGMIDAAALAAMKKTAYIYNYGRGPIIDEPALVDALKTGRIAGAGLDVFAVEPLPQDSPLWQMPNVIITPHIGGTSPIYNDRLTDLFASNLRKYLNNEPLTNVVNRERGY